MNETTENFWQVFANLEPWEPPRVLYRLYYDKDGNPLEYSHLDKPGNYVEVDPKLFVTKPRNVKVINGQIVEISMSRTTKKLVPNITQGICCDPRDVCIVVDSQQAHIKWSMKTNETN